MWIYRVRVLGGQKRKIHWIVRDNVPSDFPDAARTTVEPAQARFLQSSPRMTLRGRRSFRPLSLRPAAPRAIRLVSSDYAPGPRLVALRPPTGSKKLSVSGPRTRRILWS